MHRDGFPRRRGGLLAHPVTFVAPVFNLRSWHSLRARASWRGLCELARRSEQRAVLEIALTIKVTLFVADLAADFFTHSIALLGDWLDILGDVIRRSQSKRPALDGQTYLSAAMAALFLISAFALLRDSKVRLRERGTA